MRSSRRLSYPPRSRIDVHVGERDRKVRWVAAYACGVAWAGIDPDDVTGEIIDATDADPVLVEAAIAIVHDLPSLDDRSRRRACSVLQRTLADLDLTGVPEAAG